MKNKFISGLLWIIAFSVVLQSCRNDYLADQQEIHSNSSQFQYTSKRISLAESKHKTKLLPEIEQVENGLRESMNNTLGKTINYGNGVSIDTDEVIYIEKASGFHTYTFNIKRENEAPTAPLQNLVLSPLPDGSYRELLITYYLTAQEKQTLLSGGQIDTKGKLSVLELEQGTFNQGNQIQGAINCSWVEETVFQCCSEGVHDQSNFNKWLECKAEIPPKVFTIVTHKCTAVPATTALGNDGEGGGGGSGGGGLGSGNDDDDIPTQPNLSLPSFTDPCKKTKTTIDNANNVLHDNTVKSNMVDVLKPKVDDSKEWVVALGQYPNGSYQVTSAVEGTENSGTPPVGQLNSAYIGDGHTHPKNPGKPSAGDLYGMLEIVKVNPNFKYRYVFGITITGTKEVYALVLNDNFNAELFLSKYSRDDNYDIFTHGFKGSSNLGKEADKIKTIYGTKPLIDSSGEYYNMKALALAYILDSQNAGISLAKADANGNLKKINVSIEEITLPNGMKDEKIIVSECP